MPRLRPLLALCLVAACHRDPDDLREWKPSDHDHTDNPRSDQVDVTQDAGSPLAAHGIDEVTVVAWHQNCTRCHGPLGRGDGPQGPMTHARNLSDPTWQAGITDEGIAQAITQGRGLMPAANLPEHTVQALVRLVRLLGAHAEAAASAGAAPPAGAAPSASAAPGDAGGQ